MSGRKQQERAHLVCPLVIVCLILVLISCVFFAGVSAVLSLPLEDMFQFGLSRDVPSKLADDWLHMFEEGHVKYANWVNNSRVPKELNLVGDNRFCYIQLPAGGGWHANAWVTLRLLVPHISHLHSNYAHTRPLA